MNAPTVSARLVDRAELSGDVCALTFQTGASLTGVEPGAHVDLHLTGDQGEDLVRSYSLVSWDDAGRTLRIAVKQEPEGRGGSRAVHRLPIGTSIELAGPRNNFALREDDAPVVLLAGGIGVTPLYAMAGALDTAGRAFELHYYARSRELAAFDAELTALGLGGRYALHCDDEEGIPDFWDFMDSRPGGTHYYVCGPEPMLNAVLKTADELGRTVFHERFSATPFSSEGPDSAFDVVLERSGETVHVDADTTILTALRDAGHDVDYSCGEGTCGTCIIDVLSGDIDHRDGILTDDEKAAGDCLCVCVSRCTGPRLVLDY